MQFYNISHLRNWDLNPASVFYWAGFPDNDVSRNDTFLLTLKKG